MRSKRPADLDHDESTFVAEFEAALGPMASRFAHCPAPDLLLASHGDALPPSVAAALRAHIERCALCGPLVRDLAELAEIGLSDAQREDVRARVLGEWQRTYPEPRSRAASDWWRWLAISTAVAAAALVLAMLPAGRMVTPAVPSPRSMRPDPVKSPSVLGLDKPAVMLPLAAVLTPRGAGSRMVDVQEGLALYHDDDFRGAAERLARVVPNEAMPQLAVYLAVSYLQIDDPAGAERTLLSAREQSGNAVADDIEWYLALAHERLGQTRRARDEFGRLCEGHGSRALQACVASLELSR